MENIFSGLTDERQEIINYIIILEKKYFKIYKLKLKYEELFNRKNTKINIQIKNIKSQIRKFENLLSKYDDDKYNKDTRKRFPMPKNQIIYFDYKYRANSYELFTLLRLEENSKRIISILNKLRNVYLGILSIVKDDDYITKSQIKEILYYITDSIKREKLKMISENDCNDKKEEINSKITNLKRENINFKKNNENSLPNLDVYNKILKGESIEDYSLVGIMYAFKNIIQKYEINENLKRCSNYIISRLDNSEICINFLYFIIDSIKIRKQKFDKDSDERLILNQIYKEFKKIKELFDYSEDTINSMQTKYLYDMVSILLYDESSYLAIKNLIKNYPTTVNATSDGKHIIENIFEFYLSNYKKAITGNKTNYVNIDYLREVYYLFVNDPNIQFGDEIKYNIDKQIENFLKSVTNDKNKKQVVIDGKSISTIFVKNEKRKNYIVEELNKLSTYYKEEKLEYDLKKVNNDNLNGQIDCMLHMDCSNEEGSIDLTDEENIVLNNDFVSYNYKCTTSSNILRISVCDISSLITEYSDINNYMYNQMLENKEIDERILNRFRFKDCKEMPAITFKISLDKNNNPIDIYIYRSKIKTKKVGKDNKTYKNIQKVVDDIIAKKGYEFNCPGKDKIEIVLKNLVNELYLKYASDNKIPIIYSGTERVKPIKVNVYNNLIPILNRISKTESNNIYNIMTGNLGEFHYSSKPFGVDGYYDLGLISEPNYIFLENQRIIKLLIINGLNVKNTLYDNIRESIEYENSKMIEDLNASVGYKPIYDCNQRIKKKTLIS